MKMENKGVDLKQLFIPDQKKMNIKQKDNFIEGTIYKRSQYLKKWELRYIAINAEGLFSYKSLTEDPFIIKPDTVKEIWTRFQINDRMIVIKIHHGGKKTEFAFPFADYTIISEHNWLYPFYKLMFNK